MPKQLHIDVCVEERPVIMDLPKHVSVYPDAEDFQKALEFLLERKFDVHEGTVYGSRSLEVFDAKVQQRERITCKALCGRERVQLTFVCFVWPCDCVGLTV